MNTCLCTLPYHQCCGRGAVPSDNVFRYFAPEPMPPIPDGYTAPLEMKTAAEYQAERLARKRGALT